MLIKLANLRCFKNWFQRHICGSDTIEKKTHWGRAKKHYANALSAFRIQLVNFLIEENKCKIAAAGARPALLSFSSLRCVCLLCRAETNVLIMSDIAAIQLILWCEYQIFCMYVCASHSTSQLSKQSIPSAGRYISFEKQRLSDSEKPTSDIITAQPTL
jgi:hypothetical protein